MKTTVVERRAELLRLYTGLPWRSARRRVEAAAPGALLIPQPDTDQMLLEARVMAAVAWRRITTVHPWGIEYVDPRCDRLLIRFEADPVERRYPDETQARDLADALLPRVDEYGDIVGVPGARAHIEDGKVVLRVLGTSASVTLLGLDPDAWLHAADTHAKQVSNDGMTPCHRDLPTQRHPAEQPHPATDSPGTVCSAWLTSGLLRRVGLIRTLGVPLAVTGWLGHHERDGGERWVIDPMFAHGDGAVGHRRLMALLAAPGWGLPVTAVDETCNCHLPPGGSDQCITLATSPEGRPGVIEIRTIQRRGERLKWIQDHNPAIYAIQRHLALPVPTWIDRWLASHGSPAPDVPADVTSPC